MSEQLRYSLLGAEQQKNSPLQFVSHEEFLAQERAGKGPNVVLELGDNLIIPWNTVQVGNVSVEHVLGVEPDTREVVVDTIKLHMPDGAYIVAFTKHPETHERMVRTVIERRSTGITECFPHGMAEVTDGGVMELPIVNAAREFEEEGGLASNFSTLSELRAFEPFSMFPLSSAKVHAFVAWLPYSSARPSERSRDSNEAIAANWRTINEMNGIVRRTNDAATIALWEKLPLEMKEMEPWPPKVDVRREEQTRVANALYDLEEVENIGYLDASQTHRELVDKLTQETPAVIDYDDLGKITRWRLTRAGDITIQHIVVEKGKHPEKISIELEMPNLVYAIPYTRNPNTKAIEIMLSIVEENGKQRLTFPNGFRRGKSIDAIRTLLGGAGIVSAGNPISVANFPLLPKLTKAVAECYLVPVSFLESQLAENSLWVPHSSMNSAVEKMVDQFSVASWVSARAALKRRIAPGSIYPIPPNLQRKIVEEDGNTE